MTSMERLFAIGEELANSEGKEWTLVEEFEVVRREKEQSLSLRVQSMLSNTAQNLEENYLLNEKDIMLDWSKMLKKRQYIEKDEKIDLEEELKRITRASFDLKPIVDRVHQQVHPILEKFHVNLEEKSNYCLAYFPHNELILELLRLYREEDYYLCFALRELHCLREQLETCCCTLRLKLSKIH